ncbi:MAG TPA: ABC transporter permease subunit [Clostridia bacterium]|nr:ABC transporter permease subunit [Clostridia bacterium]
MVASRSASDPARRKRKAGGWAYWIANYELYLFLLPALVYYLIFCYWPMYGVQIAFREYTTRGGITGSTWIGLGNFRRMFFTPGFLGYIANTLWLSGLSLAIGFPMPIVFSLMLNEVRNAKLKRLVQTVSYAPHFISVVVLVSMLLILLNKDYGVVNMALRGLGFNPVHFLAESKYFRPVYVLSGIWQGLGWNSIIYLSALSGIDPQLHEAARIDGASRLKRIWHINIPGILPTVTIMLIMASGSLMSVGFEKVFLMQNSLNLNVSEVISTYVYKVGLMSYQFSFSAAVGLLNSVVNCLLLLAVNWITRSLNQTSLL